MAASDPKTNRALGQTSSRGDVDSDEDPLVELARIVSEDNGFSSGRVEKKAARADVSANDALSDDLEAELLQELESSFAAREAPPPPRNIRPVPAATRGNTATAPTRALAPPSPPADEDEADPDELLRSIEQQLSQFERRQAGRFGSTTSDPSAEPEDSRSADDDETTEEASAELPFGAPAKVAEASDAWQGRRESRIRSIAEEPEPAADVQEGPDPWSDEPVSARRTEYRFRGPADADWDRPPAAREEPESPMPEQQAVTRHTPSQGANGAHRVRSDDGLSAAAPRRERLQTPFPEFDEEDSTERAAPDFSGVETSLSRELRPRFSESAPSDKWQDGDATPEASRVAAAVAPGVSRRAAAARAAAAQRGRSRIGLFLAALIVVGVIGGGAAFYLRSFESTPSGPPPLIAAEPGAVRVEASAEQQSQPENGETVGDAVYNRVAGNTPTTEERVVDNSEEPREVARIVLPPSASGDSVARSVGEDGAADAASDQQPAATAPAESAEVPAPAVTEPPAPASTADSVGPRRVPTFVIKSDGSIVATSEAGVAAPDPTAAQEQQLTSETEPIEPVPVATVAIAQSNGANAVSPPAPAVSAPAEQAAEPEGAQPPPIIEEPPAEMADAVPPEVAAPAEAPAPAEPPAPQPVDEPANATVAATEPATQAPAPSASGGGFFVQLSSEGSMEDGQASYARVRQRFPSVLGSLDPQIQRADLGAKGVFYRVRVGPWATRPEAIQVCESLKAAGGSCFVAK